MRASLLALALLLPLAACETPEDGGAPPAGGDAVADESPSVSTMGAEYAVARVEPLGTSEVSGTVEFRSISGGMEIRYDLNGLSAGTHGFHVHENSSCATDAEDTPGGAAGGHFNPLASPHGSPTDARTERHAGDLGNIEADAAGRAMGIQIDSLLAFSGPTSIVGKTLLVHGGRDDLTSQPSGDAGDRVGCAVISLATPSAPAAASPTRGATPATGTRSDAPVE